METHELEKRIQELEAQQLVHTRKLQSKYKLKGDDIVKEMNILIDEKISTLNELDGILEEQLSECEEEYELNDDDDEVEEDSDDDDDRNDEDGNHEDGNHEDGNHEDDNHEDEAYDEYEEYLEKVASRLERFKTYVQTIKTEKNMMERQRQGLQKLVDDHQKELLILTKVTNALDQLIDTQQKFAIDSLTSILTTGLNMMFGVDVQVKILHKIAYNQFEFDIQTEVKNANGEIISGNHDGFGGSLTTIESLLLRVITILKFKMRRILLLDEFFGSLDHDRIEALGTLISLLVEKYQFDILCITHDDDLAQLSDICYEIQNLKKGVTFKKVIQKSQSTPTE
jgi:hypothetical protein